MTVPMKQAIAPKTQGSSNRLKCGSESARNSRPSVAATRPQDGNAAVRPVRVTNWPVTSDPMPMPNMSGSINKPVSAGAAPRTARR
jgi:hypothetical protein